MSADNHQARRLQILARLALVTGLAVAAVLIFTDLGSSPSPDRKSSPAERLVSLSSPRPLTRIDSSTGTRPIESIRLGDRVLASNPEVTDAERSSWAEPDWNDWLHLSLQMQMPSRDHQADRSKILDIELLRPQSWLRQQLRFVIDSTEKIGEFNKPDANAETSPHTLTSVSAPLSRSSDLEQAYVDKAAVPFSPLAGVYREIAITSALIAANGMDLIGLTVQMDLPEMGAAGTAVITGIRPCPAVRPGDGQPVTATFSHPPANAVLNVVFEGESEPIGVTDNHLFWSVDRQQFLPIGKMEIGEQVQTFHGDTKRITQKLARPGPQTVYNLEVYGEHVYFVGDQGILAHNQYNAPSSGLTTLDPSGIRFSQTTVKQQGATVNGIADSMRRNGFIPEPEPGKFLDVVRMSDGGLTTLDNTRILAARRAGVNVEARLFNFDDALPNDPRFIERFIGPKGQVPTTFGEAVLNRIGNQSGKFRRVHPLGSPITGSAF